MPPSGGNQFILDLLAKSVAKVNSLGLKRETQEKAGNLLTSSGVKRGKVEDIEDKDHSTDAIVFAGLPHWSQLYHPSNYQLLLFKSFYKGFWGSTT